MIIGGENYGDRVVRCGACELVQFQASDEINRFLNFSKVKNLKEFDDSLAFG